MAEDLRKANMQTGLTEADAGPDPIALFGRWFDAALAAGVPDANAMTLATATPDGKPSARTVLLKHFDDRGFAFYTNYQSRKGRELAANPHAALVFWWQQLARQIRIEGHVELTSAAESDTYFASRPLDSQIGAVVSPQSDVIPDRAVLEQRAALLERHFVGRPPRPKHWGGYRLIPSAIEFWQSRPGRLHDRLCYTLQPDGAWRRERLAP